MFTESLVNILPNVRLISWELSEQELKGRDAIVFAAANWIATGVDLGHLAERIEKTDLPVFLIGVGAQSGLSKSVPKLSSGTLRFLSVVSERSKTISTRGNFTCEVLEHYGFKNSVATGCPSLLLAGKEGPVFNKVPTTENILIHGTRHRFHHTDDFQNYFYRQALDLEIDILLQSETPDIMIAQGVEIPSDEREKAYSALQKSYGTSDESRIERYLREHGKFFANYDSWLDCVKTYSLCVGTRIHGTIASINAGTPSLLIAHDSRTQELADSMGVPYLLSDHVNICQRLNVEAFIDAFQRKKSGFSYVNYRERFRSMFDHNGLKALL